MKRVAIVGATGFLGRALAKALAARGDAVIALSRNPRPGGFPPAVRTARFDPNDDQPQPEAFEGVDAVVNLAGDSIGGRWSEQKKRAIYDSRVAGTRHLVASIAACRARAKLLVSASGAGYYGSRGEEMLVESSPPGTDFLARLSADWEREADAARDLGVRVVRLRQGIVLGRNGGALAAMLPPFKLGLGGRFGSGRQWWPWIHIHDDVGLMLFALDSEELSGAVNAVSPGLVRNAEFASALGGALSRPAILPAPAFALRMLLGEFADSLLASQRLLPDKARESGFSFRYEGVDRALCDVFGRR